MKGRKNTEENSQPETMFRDCTQPVQDLLKQLSLWGYIYIGRTGVGLTTSFRKGLEVSFNQFFTLLHIPD